MGVYSIEFKDEQSFSPVIGLWGVGFSLLSSLDKKTGLRTSIGVFDMELNKVHFDYDSLEENTKDYYEGRKKWLTQIDNSKWIDIKPLKIIKNSDNHIEGYRIGFEYSLDDITQIQYSYYLMCNTRMFHLKALMAKQNEFIEESKISKIVHSFSCKRNEENVGRFKASDIKKNWSKVNASSKLKYKTLSAIREFLLSYELAHQDNSETESSDAINIKKIRSLFQQTFEVTTAWASDESCFYGGWESVWVKTKSGKTTCSTPSSTKGCGQNFIKCNPAIFGESCISSEFRQNATQVCNSEYLRLKDKHDKEIKFYLADNPDLISKLQLAVDETCSKESYRNSNYGLCTTLYDRIGVLANDLGAKLKLPEPKIVPSDHLTKGDYDKAYDVTQKELQLFENFCLAPDKKTMYAQRFIESKIIDCAEMKSRLMANLKALDKLEYNKIKKIDENSCLARGTNPTSATQINQLRDLTNSCTESDKEEKSQCGSDIMCAVVPSQLIGYEVVPPKR